jgi:enterochelin esterase family protein
MTLLLAAAALAGSFVSPSRVEPLTLHQRDGGDRPVWVYVPAGYDESHAPYPTAFFFDGADYNSDLQLVSVLDRLIAGRQIPPMLAVMVDTAENRLGDLANHASFAALVGDELVPWLRSQYRMTRDPRRTIVAGYSAGGLGAVYCALRRPEIFGNVISQSGAVWRGNEGSSSSFEWLKDQFASVPKLDLRFYLEVGAAETQRVMGRGPVFIEATRRLRDVLRAKGYDVTYVEVPGATHSPEHWRAQLPTALVAMAGRWLAAPASGQ